MHAHAVFSHLTAARLYGLPLPNYVDNEQALHVSVPAAARAPRGQGVTGHVVKGDLWTPRDFVFRDFDRGEMFALPIASPALVWFQLATILDPWDLVALGDAMVSGDVPLTTLAELERVVIATRGMRGAKVAAAVVGDIRRGSRSRPESILRLQCVAAGIPEPMLNTVVHDRAGNEIWTPDLQWLVYRTLLEYQGDGHRSKGKFRSDVSRLEDYRDGGWHPMQAHADDVFGDPNPLLRRVARRLAAQGWVPGCRELPRVAAARR